MMNVSRLRLTGGFSAGKRGRRAIRTLRPLAIAALLAAWAAPAMAQSMFHKGDLVSGDTGDKDTACLSQGELERYISVKEGCPLGDTDDCKAVTDLEAKGVCGVHSDSYVVVSVDAQLGWMQVSPTSDQSTVYWADERDFVPAQ